jgi:hypothetical protein
MSAIQIASAPSQSPYDVLAKFQPTAGATSLSLSDTPMVGTLRVYRNGLLLSDGGDYVLSDIKYSSNPRSRYKVRT